MNDPVHLFVGTDMRMGAMERTLEYTVRKHCSSDVLITWMRYGDPDWTDEWNRGVPDDQKFLPYGPFAWATGFSCFRWCVPELIGFHGRAIYLDVDMIVLGDLRELFEQTMPTPVMIPDLNRWDVILFDCEAFRDLKGWPSIEEMKPSGWRMNHYQDIIRRHEMVSHSDPNWDCVDGNRMCADTKLLHCSRMDTQTMWKPWPDRFGYDTPHPCPEFERVWLEWMREAGA